MITSLQELVLLLKEGEQKIVLATGTFDLFHYEHLRYLEDAKKLGDILVVAVKNNKCAALKGSNRPIIDEQQRAAIVDSIKYVDYVLLVDYDENAKTEIEYDNDSQRQWLIMFCDVFKYLKPHIVYYEINPLLQTARDRVFAKYHIQGVSRARTAIISTSKIIKKLTEPNNGV